jgi:hypothetical protein
MGQDPGLFSLAIHTSLNLKKGLGAHPTIQEFLILSCCITTLGLHCSRHTPGRKTVSGPSSPYSA